MRKSVVVIQDVKNQQIHFCENKLQGIDSLLYFSGNEKGLFAVVEQFLMANAIAQNVTSVELLRECGINKEYKVTYNEAAFIEEKSNSIERGTSVHNSSLNLTGMVLSLGDGKVTVITTKGRLDWDIAGLEVIDSD